MRGTLRFRCRQPDMNRCLTIPVLLLFALTLSCGAPEQSADGLVEPDKTTIVAPVETPFSTTTPTTTLDAPPRRGNVRLVDGRTAPVVRTVPRDLIPAVFDPVHLPAGDVGEQVLDTSSVIGVAIGDESVAYSVSHLSSREIVNDTVGGTPIAVTW